MGHSCTYSFLNILIGYVTYKIHIIRSPFNDIGNVNIFITIIVIICNAHPKPVGLEISQAGFIGNLCKGAISVVFIQM